MNVLRVIGATGGDCSALRSGRPVNGPRASTSTSTPQSPRRKGQIDRVRCQPQSVRRPRTLFAVLSIPAAARRSSTHDQPPVAAGASQWSGIMVGRLSTTGPGNPLDFPSVDAPILEKSTGDGDQRRPPRLEHLPANALRVGQLDCDRLANVRKAQELVSSMARA
jgi:hypothetical protein